MKNDTKKECPKPNQRKSTPRALPRSEHNYIKLLISLIVLWGFIGGVAGWAFLAFMHPADSEAQIEPMQITLRALDARVERLEQSHASTEAAKPKAKTEAKKPLKSKNSTQANQKAPKTAKMAAFKPQNNNEANEYKITFYCPCEKCCGKWAGGNTASGTKPTASRTVAAPKSFAFGTQIRIDGLGHYVVEDRGGAIKGNRLDVFVDSHAEALRLGVMHKEVSIVHD